MIPEGERRAISHEDVQRAADAKGLSLDAVLALIARTDDRYVVVGMTPQFQDTRFVMPEPAAAGTGSDDGSRSLR